VWAPRFRTWLNRWLSRMDRRTCRKLAANNQSILDWQWHRADETWWNDQQGWSTGAEPPEQAYATMIRNRRPAPWPAGRFPS
jgi:hypothetical protein